MINVSCGVRSEIGARRLNEDRYVAGARIWAVADGMGGHAAGDVASALVIERLTALDDADAPISPEDILDALAVAHASVVRHGEEHPEAHGLGSTVTGLAHVMLDGDHRWAIFNVGDSRVYRMIEGTLVRATIDHSEIEALVLEGVISPEQARSHPLRHIITRSIGAPQEPPQVDMWVFPMGEERVLICSDGLNSELPDATIAQILDDHPAAQDAADALVEAALGEGGHDNVTVIVLNIHADSAA